MLPFSKSELLTLDLISANCISLIDNLINIWQMFNVGTDAITAKPHIQNKFISMNLLQVLRDNRIKKKSASSLKKENEAVF